MELLTSLLLAHVIGDFCLQSDKIVNDKLLNKHKSAWLYWHIAVHAVLTALMLRFNMAYLGGYIAIVFSHYVFDLAKSHFQTATNSRVLFFTDQAAHIVVIVAVAFAYGAISVPAGGITAAMPGLELITIAILCLTFVAAVVMQVLMSAWNPVLEGDGDNTGAANDDSLQNAGKYIGMLERLFVFGFIVAGQWQGIGFLLAAKSVFRFGDLSRAQDRRLTEYILVGTLLSFGMAILIAVAYQHFAAMLGAVAAP